MFDKSHMEMLPISSLNALEYCPRKFYYQFVQGEMLVNEFVLEGTLAHQRVHQAGTHTTAEGEMQTTQLYLSSEALRLSGFADVVEERSGVLVPVEYKRGQQGQWLNDHIQLCAQAFCLEERQQDRPPLAYGYIFYVASLRRVQVNFTAERMTLVEGLAKAGGLQDLRSDPGGVFLFRFEPPGIVNALGRPQLHTGPDGSSPVVYRLDLSDAKSYFLAQRFAMHDKDIIYVANADLNELQKFFTLLNTLTGPIITGIVVKGAAP